jgi:hypothetical protein
MCGNSLQLLRVLAFQVFPFLLSIQYVIIYHLKFCSAYLLEEKPSQEIKRGEYGLETNLNGCINTDSQKNYSSLRPASLRNN